MACGLVLLGAAPRSASAQAPADSARCFECGPRPRHPLGASAQLLAAWLTPWSLNRFVANQPWARVGPSTWWHNLTSRWVWDDNSFLTNQFLHPYHGNLYFNAFRTNGYGYWGSSAAAWAGAFVWECCGEDHPGAPNDLINTALGGMALGEMFYRLSGLILDDRASGSGRLGREVAALIVDPQRGFNRLFSGRFTRVGPNPPDARPDWLQATADLGFYRFDDRFSVQPPAGREGELLRLFLTYGNPATSVPRKPFSFFQVGGDILLGGGSSILQLAARGNLLGRSLGPPDALTRHTFGAFLNYDYLNHTTTEFGMQSVTAGLMSQWRLSSRTVLVTEELGRAIVLAGVRTPNYIVTGEGRDYDYGPGAGTRLDATLLVNAMGALRAGYGVNWFHTVNGAGADHLIQLADAELRTEISDHLGLGISWRYIASRTKYVGRPSDLQKSRQWTYFVTSALPRWNF